MWQQKKMRKVYLKMDWFRKLEREASLSAKQKKYVYLCGRKDMLLFGNFDRNLNPCWTDTKKPGIKNAKILRDHLHERGEGGCTLCDRYEPNWEEGEKCIRLYGLLNSHPLATNNTKWLYKWLKKTFPRRLRVDTCGWTGWNYALLKKRSFFVCKYYSSLN